jgi:hypothetical protein
LEKQLNRQLQRFLLSALVRPLPAPAGIRAPRVPRRGLGSARDSPGDGGAKRGGGSRA